MILQCINALQLCLSGTFFRCYSLFFFSVASGLYFLHLVTLFVIVLVRIQRSDTGTQVLTTFSELCAGAAPGSRECFRYHQRCCR